AGTLVTWASESWAGWVAGDFGPNGEGGLINGQTLTFGSQGSVYELDAFLNIAGRDLNGSDAGTSAQLSNGPPAGIDYRFAYNLSADQSNLTLNYQLVNLTGQSLPGVQFFHYVDA